MCERFEPRNNFKSGLSLIVRVNVVLNRTVVVDSRVIRDINDADGNENVKKKKKNNRFYKQNKNFARTFLCPFLHNFDVRRPRVL